MTMYSFTISISLIVAFLITAQAAPIRSFHDVEKAWKEGRSDVSQSVIFVDDPLEFNELFPPGLFLVVVHLVSTN